MSNKVKTYQSHVNSLNFESCLCGVVLGLLSRDFGYVVARPQKFSTLTVPFIRIKEIKTKNERIDVRKYIKMRGQNYISSMEKEGLSGKTIERRERARRRMEIMHLLEDYLYLNGIDVQIELETINGVYGEVIIYSEKQVLFTNESIRQIGKEITDYIVHKLGTCKSVMIERGELRSFIN